MRSLIPSKRHHEVTGFEPFHELDEWHRKIDELFSNFAGKEPFEGTAFAGGPPLENFLRNGSFVVRADLPGVEPKEIDISVSGDVLTVKGERKHEKESEDDRYTRREIAYGSFERSMMLPRGIDSDKMKASYDKGVLEITMPAPKELTPKKVAVQVEAKK